MRLSSAARDFALALLRARVDQLFGPDEAADMVGAKGRFGALLHGSRLRVSRFNGHAVRVKGWQRSHEVCHGCASFGPAGFGLCRGSRQGFGRLGELWLRPPRPAAHRQSALDARVPHGRPQAAHHRRCRRRARASASSAGRWRTRRRSMRWRRGSRSGHQGRARRPRARRRAAREGSDRAQRSARQSARDSFTAPRRRPSRSSPAATSRASAPARSAWATWCSTSTRWRRSID